MKMENTISAEQDGTVAEVKVSAGETVSTGTTLVVLE
jgi:acetyl-CoA/propionyl-CoA carboxylase biotin carboxyl carrier protein